MSEVVEYLERLYGQKGILFDIFEASPSRVGHLTTNYQIDEQTLLGNVLLHTGGILVDNWLRIYGSGRYDFTSKNEELSDFGALLVAEDVTGGLFAQKSDGRLQYFSADCLQWEDLGITYPEFIEFSTSVERLATFYAHVRWEGWELVVKNLHADEGISYYPFLWSKESNDGFSTKIVPMVEIFELEKSLWKTV